MKTDGRGRSTMCVPMCSHNSHFPTLLIFLLGSDANYSKFQGLGIGMFRNCCHQPQNSKVFRPKVGLFRSSSVSVGKSTHSCHSFARPRHQLLASQTSSHKGGWWMSIADPVLAKENSSCVYHIAHTQHTQIYIYIYTVFLNIYNIYHISLSLDVVCTCTQRQIDGWIDRLTDRQIGIDI